MTYGSTEKFKLQMQVDGYQMNLQKLTEQLNDLKREMTKTKKGIDQY